MDKIVSLARRRGFVFPSSEIYGGLGSSYDYGHYGVLLKENVKARWLEAMVRERDDIVALDSSIILHPAVWEASGHVTGFADPLVDCRFCKRRYRADQIADAECGARPSKHPGRDRQVRPHRAAPVQPHVLRRGSGRSRRRARTRICAPRPRRASSSTSRTSPRSRDASRRSASRRSARRSGTRSRRGTSSSARSSSSRWRWSSSSRPPRPTSGFGSGSRSGVQWHLRYGIRESHLRVREHDAEELSHYSSATSDLEYLFPMGWSELEGIAHRGDFDLTAHTEASGTKLEWVDGQERYTPHVVEPALGVNRSMLAFLVDAYDEEVVAERERTVLRLHPALAPVKVAVLPLISKNEDMVGKARVSVRGASAGRGSRVRRLGPDRPPLPPPGRDRDAVRAHDRRADARGRHRHDPRPRLARTGANSDLRGSCLVQDKLAEDWTTPKTE